MIILHLFSLSAELLFVRYGAIDGEYPRLAMSPDDFSNISPPTCLLCTRWGRLDGEGREEKGRGRYRQGGAQNQEEAFLG